MTTVTDKIICKSATAKGNPCTRTVVEGRRYCYQHDNLPAEPVEAQPAEESPGPVVCANCREAVAEEYRDYGAEPDDEAEIADIAVQFGADIPDHDCDRVDSGTACACGCGQHATPEPVDACVDCGNPDTFVGATGHRRCEPCYVVYRESAFVYSQPGDIHATDTPRFQTPEQRGHSEFCWKAKPICATCNGRICALGCPKFRTANDVHHAYGRCVEPEQAGDLVDLVDGRVVPAVAVEPTPSADPELPTDWHTWGPGKKAAWTRKNRPGQTTTRRKTATVDAAYYRTQPANWCTMSAGQKAAWTRKNRQLVAA